MHDHKMEKNEDLGRIGKQISFGLDQEAFPLGAVSTGMMALL